MQVFVFEYISGGGMAGRPLPHSLAREGWAMLTSVLADLARIRDVAVTTILDRRLRARELPAAVAWVDEATEPLAFCQRAAAADWTLVIAPEFDGILCGRAERVEQVGGRLLGPTPAAIAQTGDKWTCEQRLRAAGVPTADSRIVRPSELPGDFPYPAVLKPRDGAGSQATAYIADAARRNGVAAQLATEVPERDWLLQRFVPGLPASVACLAGPRGVEALQAGEQILSGDGRFRYLGGRLPLDPPRAARARELARRAMTAVPGLRGYAGVDLVLGPGDTPGGDTVIEINPRLTTSYVGLRCLARQNLAEHMLAVVQGQPVAPIVWRDIEVRFSADGQIR
jgi:hypothetical protein